MSQRRPARLDDRHALPLSRIASDRPIDSELVFLHVPPRGGQVTPTDFAPRDRSRQSSVCLIRAGDHHEAAGVLVQTVHDARSIGLADRRQAAQPMKQGVDQRATSVPHGGMHDQSGLLVDYGQVFVMVDDLDRDRLGIHGGGGRRRDRDLHLVSRSEPMALPGQRAVDEDQAIAHELGDPAATQMQTIG